MNDSLLKNDFADWLSPMVVKELRQGMRARAFVSTFTLLQVSLAVMVILFAISFSGDPEKFDTSDVSKVFWFLLGAYLLAVSPLRALNAISSEVKANTLELMMLTRMHSWRIVWGKWLSVLFQNFLVVISVLPYGVVRYFFGDVNLTEDLQTVSSLFLVSALLSAVFIGLSRFPAWVKGSGCVVMFFLTLSYAIPHFFSGSLMGVSSAVPWEIWVFWTIDYTVIALLSLCEAANRIASPADNYAMWKRLLSLVLILSALVCIGLKMDEGLIRMQGFLAFFVWGYVAWDGLMEGVEGLSSHCRRFVRLGLLGRWLGRFLYSTWPSAMLFILILGIPVGWALAALRNSSDLFYIVLMGSILGLLLISTLLVPKACLALLRWNPGQKFLVFLIFQAAFILIFVFVLVIAEASGEDEVYSFLALFPPSAFWAAAFDKTTESSNVCFPLSGLAGTGLTMGVLMWASKAYWKRLKELEKRAIAALAAQKAKG